MLGKIARVLLAVAGCFVSGSIAQPLVPSAISIVSPDRGLDRSIAAFSGAWGGHVADVAVVMVVEEIGPARAIVVYAWDDAPQSRTVKGNSRFVAAVSKGDAATLDFGTDRVKRHATMDADLSSVHMTITLPTEIRKGTLRRLREVPKTPSVRAPALASVPLPPDLTTSAPDDSLPAPVRAYAGQWFGTWDHLLDHLLVVERIESLDRVAVVYAWSTAPAWNIHEPGFMRTSGRIVEGRLEIKGPNGAVVTYGPFENGELLARYEIGTAFAKSRMVRVAR